MGGNKMIHKITQADIDAGEPGMCSDCPVALSLLRHYEAVMVGPDKITTRIIQSGGLEFHNTPKKVSAFIKHFDSKKSVEPMEFELGD